MKSLGGALFFILLAFLALGTLMRSPTTTVPKTPTTTVAIPSPTRQDQYQHCVAQAQSDYQLAQQHAAPSPFFTIAYSLLRFFGLPVPDLSSILIQDAASSYAWALQDCKAQFD